MTGDRVWRRLRDTIHHLGSDPARTTLRLVCGHELVFEAARGLPPKEHCDLFDAFLEKHQVNRRLRALVCPQCSRR